jgi:hypothetical protein
VIRHTTKFVIFAPENCSRESIRILPKRDEARTQDRIAISDGAEEDQTRTQGQRERDNISYDALPETANFPVYDGDVSFTRTFRYIGSLINYNYSLCDDDDITARIASATAAMGALKEVWRNPHLLDAYNKFLHFRAIPMNLLLWGAETWSLRKSQLNQLEVFLHRSIRRILQISMSTVKEEKNRNERVPEMFYSIPCVRNMIAARQTDFIGKMMRGPPHRRSLNMITACCDHKQ